VPGTSSLTLAFPLSSAVRGGSETIGFTTRMREHKKRELHTRDQSCQLGSSGWIAYESAFHR
jgi:hypothetical protein